jgi:SAM-dependent methyltransferase
MERSYYRQYYALERNHWWFVVRSSLIRRCLGIHLPEQKNRRILNIGTATGATSDMLAYFGEVVSSEFDHETCVFLREELGMDVTEASVTELPFDDESFDLVCAFDVIEHVEDDSRAMLEMKRVCKKGGFIAITVPADMDLWSQHDVINHHFRRYELKGIQTLAKKAGLKLVYESYFNTILYPPVLLVRKIKKAFGRKEKPASDFDMKMPEWIHAVLKQVFSFEKRWVGKKKMPFGVSILWLGKKE